MHPAPNPFILVAHVRQPSFADPSMDAASSGWHLLSSTDDTFQLAANFQKIRSNFFLFFFLLSLPFPFPPLLSFLISSPSFFFCFYCWRWNPGPGAC
jgi:hypothetical protein